MIEPTTAAVALEQRVGLLRLNFIAAEMYARHTQRWRLIARWHRWLDASAWAHALEEARADLRAERRAFADRAPHVTAYNRKDPRHD